MDRAGAGHRRGGIRGLIDLIDRHRSALEYDWRTRFGIGLRAIFTGEVTWREAVDLTRELLSDPSSHTAAAAHGWDEPWPRDAFILADLFDAHAQANFKNPKPYPRPTTRGRQRSARPKVSQARIRAALAARGHSLN